MTTRSASSAASASGDVLGQRALNRATLARQLLLQRVSMPVTEGVTHLVGLQAQTTHSWYVGLWSRLAAFRPAQAAELLVARRLVRIALMRSTIHLVTADDCLAVRPLVQPVLDRDLYANSTHGPRVQGLDMNAVIAAGRALLVEQPLTPGELGVLLQQRWPDRPAVTLAYAVRNLVPLVQVPPRGVWGASGQTRYATAEGWLGRPLEPAPSLQRLILRYLAAFGPASVADIQTWSGLTRLRGVVDALRPELVTFRDERGRELFDLPGAPRPDPDTPAPPRFLYDFDNVLLSHADRSRFITEDVRERLAARRNAVRNGAIPGSVLLDGVVAGTWTIARERRSARLRIEVFRSLAPADEIALAGDGVELLAFTDAAADTRDVQLTVAP